MKTIAEQSMNTARLSAQSISARIAAANAGAVNRSTSTLASQIPSMRYCPSYGRGSRDLGLGRVTCDDTTPIPDRHARRVVHTRRETRHACDAMSQLFVA